MKSKNNNIIKMVLTVVAMFLFLFGWIGGFISGLSSMDSVNSQKYYKQYPLNEKNGIAVDSDSNIYIGEGQTGSIQVYDSTGNFQYGFGFPTGGGGWFAFGIKEDRIHIVTARTDSYFIFDKGELVYSEKEIDYKRSEELQAEYNMTYKKSFFKGNKTYKISSRNTVSIKDKLNGKVERIHLKVPIWPFSFKIFHNIASASMGLIFILHHKFFLSLFKGTKKE
ncbi:hypothetical protein [Anaeromicrobium sediminis]|uniref:Uncharacterized protein n=1 Tax=Anaeromicrobium sediminis TaxID=1478221 RepID=A0A267M748_9FIRM|nr:hypothetical protein [Anaeromicrobium sediminis]PAB55461.1 hypothetical protein CCE28_21725 [Anaeromicrobium sediminis]